jgi:uncharacterized protein GlcG (DUF336 family)
MTVTLREAEKVLQAAEGKANDLGVRVSVAVLDSRGDIVALARLDGARYFTPDVAIGKALVSAALGASNRTSQGFALDIPIDAHPDHPRHDPDRH